jgi:hypothetical protein
MNYACPWQKKRLRTAGAEAQEGDLAAAFEKRNTRGKGRYLSVPLFEISILYSFFYKNSSIFSKNGYFCRF